MKKFILNEEDILDKVEDSLEDLEDIVEESNAYFTLTQKDLSNFKTKLTDLYSTKKNDKDSPEVKQLVATTIANAKLYFQNIKQNKIYIGAFHKVFDMIGGLPDSLYNDAFLANGLIQKSGYGNIKEYVQSLPTIKNKETGNEYKFATRSEILSKMLNGLSLICTVPMYTAPEVGTYTLINTLAEGEDDQENAIEGSETYNPDIGARIKNAVDSGWNLANFTKIIKQYLHAIETACSDTNTDNNNSISQTIKNIFTAEYINKRNELFAAQPGRGNVPLLVPYYTVMEKGAATAKFTPTTRMYEVEDFLLDNIQTWLADSSRSFLDKYIVGVTFECNIGVDPKKINDVSKKATSNFIQITPLKHTEESALPSATDIATCITSTVTNIQKSNSSGSYSPAWIKTVKNTLSALATNLDAYLKSKGITAQNTTEENSSNESFEHNGISILKEEYVLHDRPSRNYYIQKKVPINSTKCITTDRIVDEIPDTAEIEGITLVINKDEEPVTYIGFDPDLPYSLDSMYTEQTEFAEEADADELNNWLKTNLAYWYKK